jgi:hypothetical protein
MPETLLIVHSVVRWFLLLIGAAVVGKMALSYAKASPWTEADRKASLLFTVGMDVQFLLGIALYGVSPITRGAMGHMKEAMGSPSVRFFVAEHPMIMIFALVLAHAGAVIARKAPTDRLKFMRTTGFFALSLGLVLWGIPWWRLAGKA